MIGSARTERFFVVTLSFWSQRRRMQRSNLSDVHQLIDEEMEEILFLLWFVPEKSEYEG
jgi:hypothetical protein